jgi:hypothetical protein
MDSLDVSLDNKLRLVRVTATGELSQADGEKIVTSARKTAAEHNFDLLYDIRQATSNISLSSWFNLPRKLEVFKDFKTRLVNVAVLVSETDKGFSDYKFYEAVTENMGIKLRVFTDESEALQWLGKNNFE